MCRFNFLSYLWDFRIEKCDFCNKEWFIYLGWGTIFFGGPASDVLREVEVDVWNQQAKFYIIQNI